MGNINDHNFKTEMIKYQVLHTLVGSGSNNQYTLKSNKYPLKSDQYNSYIIISLIVIKVKSVMELFKKFARGVLYVEGHGLVEKCMTFAFYNTNRTMDKCPDYQGVLISEVS